MSSDTETRSTLILVRHAHTGMAGRFSGHSDPPLSAEGLAQLPELSERLNGCGIKHVFSSDLERTRRTAQAIAEPRSLEIRLLTSLREMAFGSWEGKNWDEVMALDAGYAQEWLDRYPFVSALGGEVYDDFCRRIEGAMNAIADEVQDSCTVVVTHAGVIRTFLQIAASKSGVAGGYRSCEYASCWEVTRERGYWALLREITPESACQAAGTRARSDGGHRF